MARWLILLAMCWFTGTIGMSAQSFIEVGVNDREPYVGEVMVYEFRFYDDGQSIGKQFIPPTFRGLGQLGESSVSQRGTMLDGVQYTVFEQDFYVFSTQSGAITIDGAVIESPETPFQSGELLVSDDVQVILRALPDSPYEIIHGVGTYEVDFSISREDVTVGNTLTVQLTVRGRGVLQAVISPTLNIDANWRVLSDAPIYQRTNAIEGEKIFRWDLIPQVGGDFTVGWENFIFFDPNREMYVMIESPEWLVVVTGTGASVSSEIIQDIMQDGFNFSWRSITTWGNFQVSWLWVMLWLLPLGISMMMILRGGIGIAAIKRPSQGRVQGRYAKRLDALARLDARALHEGMESLLLDYVSDKAGYQVREQTFEEALERLPKGRSEMLRRCWQEAIQARYAPVDDADARHLLRRMRRLFGEQSA